MIPATPARSPTSEQGPALTQTDDHPRAVVVDPREAPARTALVVQARDGFVHVFLPPLEKLEKFIELVRLIDRAATQLHIAVILEGYGPPPDSRIKTLLITPDPGVIEVNLHPDLDLGRAHRADPHLVRNCPRTTALRRDVRARRATQRHRRRQSHHPRRPRTHAITVAPPA